MSSNRAGLVWALGLGLIAANLAITPQGRSLWKLLTEPGGTTPPDPTTPTGNQWLGQVPIANLPLVAPSSDNAPDPTTIQRSLDQLRQRNGGYGVWQIIAGDPLASLRSGVLRPPGRFGGPLS